MLQLHNLAKTSSPCLVLQFIISAIHCKNRQSQFNMFNTLLCLFAISIIFPTVLSDGIKFDEQYLRLQGYQIAGVLEAKAQNRCWKTAFEALKKDCQGVENKLVVWVFHFELL